MAGITEEPSERLTSVYNAWLTANLTLASEIPKFLRGPIITVQVLKAVFERVIVESLRGG